MDTHHHLRAEGIAVSLDLGNGHLASLAIEQGGRILTPLHRAPWVDGGEPLPDGLPSGLTRLSGDFFCAPFSASDIEPAPTHGWSANAPWSLVGEDRFAGGCRATFRLSQPVMGAVIEKVLILRDGHPFLYQEHRITGGVGALPVAHHTMTRMQAGGRIDVSPKRLALTPDAALEPDPARGRHALAYPARSADLSAFPLAQGGHADLHAYPPAERHEDFVTLVEAVEAPLGWTAVSRHAERDLVLVLKRSDVLPVTMLWMSNGGRDYAPWNGRHTGVLGIEDGCTAIGHRASLGDNPLSREGVTTSFTLGATITVRQVIGAVPVDDTYGRVTAIRAEPNGLQVTRNGMERLTLPFDDVFLG